VILKQLAAFFVNYLKAIIFARKATSSTISANLVNIGGEDIDKIGLTIAVKIKTAVLYRPPQSVLQFLQPKKCAFSVNTKILMSSLKRYDTIRDAILTCARKPT